MAVYIVRCAPEWPGAAQSCGGPGRSNASGHSLPTTLVYSWRDALIFFLLAIYIIARRVACVCSLILCYDWPVIQKVSQRYVTFSCMSFSHRRGENDIQSVRAHKPYTSHRFVSFVCWF